MLSKLIRKVKRKIILDFMYWREGGIHPEDAYYLVNKFLNKEK